MALSRALVASILLHAAVIAAFTWAGMIRRATAIAALPTASASSFGAAAGETFDVDAVTETPARGKRKLTSTAPAPPKQSEPRTLPKSAGTEVAKQVAPPAAVGSKPKSNSKSRSPAADSESSEGAHEQDEDGRSYGAAGLPPGVRHLPTAFTQAIAAATNRDPFWDQLPLGSVGRAEVVIDVDDDGRITLVKDDAAPALPPALARLVQRTLLLLRAGRFALSRHGPSAGRERFAIEVTLSQVPPPEGEWDNPSDTASIGFTPPSVRTPGRAYFVHGSGRRFDAQVTIASSKQR